MLIAYHYFVSGVLSGKNLLLLRHGNMRVNLSCGDGAMPQQLLNIAYIDILLKEKRRERMSEHMGSNMYIAFYKRRVFIYHGSYRLFGQTVVQFIDKEVTAY